MGFKREAPTYKLVFEDDEFDGLVVRAKSLPLGAMLAFQALQEKAGKEIEAATEVLRRFADVLIDWNLEDEDDQPVPCDFDGLASQDLPFIMKIVEAWMNAVASVPKASLPGSNSAGTSALEPSIPMEVS